MADSCFHCGLPVPPGSRFLTQIDGAPRALCCAGCQAVAEAIAGGGLTAYYRSRTATAARQAAQDSADQLGLYDLHEVQRDFVREDEVACETTLMLEGITCAACVWLNERHLAGVPGVLLARINYTTHRALVRWDPARVRLSQILLAVRAIGYRAFPSNSAAAQQARMRENRAALWRIFVAGFGMMQVMMYALPTYLASDGSMSADIEQLMRWASLVLTLPVILYSSGPFFRAAWRDLGRRRLGMDVPVALGIAAAFAASVHATLAGGGAVYYDSIAMFVFFLLCGRFLESRARDRAAASLEHLDRAIPLAAHRLTRYPAGHDTQDVPAVSLRPGDLVMVKPGEVVPADGVLLEGETETDEALLTGESRPVVKRAGASLTAGAVNRLSPAVMRVERAGDATRVSHIRRLTERAAGERPQLTEITDRIAAWFVAGVLLVAAAAALAWYSVDPARALWIAVAVLVVTCPCALSLATPTALAIAVGTLARRGVVVTRGHAIESLARVTHVVFDKTGTLTRGALSLSTVEPIGAAEPGRVLALAAALERGSEHPIARALTAARPEHATSGHTGSEHPRPEHATSEHTGSEHPGSEHTGPEHTGPEHTGSEHTGSDDAGPEAAAVAVQLRSVAGSGVEGSIEGTTWRLGNAAFVGALTGSPPPRLPATGNATPVWLGSAAGWAARLSLSDALRPEAARVVRALRAQGKSVLILSGDDEASVRAVAAQLGIDQAAGALDPEGKHARMRALQAQGALVAMVGDGVNDAPVLAQAQVSIAMGSGAVLSQTQSDVVLLSGGLDGLLEALRGARRTMGIVHQNLAWAVAYNALALPLAVGGYVTPWMAGIGMAGSSLLVVANALRLLPARELSRPMGSGAEGTFTQPARMSKRSAGT